MFRDFSDTSDTAGIHAFVLRTHILKNEIKNNKLLYVWTIHLLTNAMGGKLIYRGLESFNYLKSLISLVSTAYENGRLRFIRLEGRQWCILPKGR